MVKRLFGAKKGKPSPGRGVPAAHMPTVRDRPDMTTEQVFETARSAAAGKGPGGQQKRQLVLVTPDRQYMLIPCAPASSLSPDLVASAEKMLSSRVERNIAVIALTEFKPISLQAAAQAVPFLGILMGFASIGHSVWIFEGHASALEAGCRDADVLIVDGGMVPHLTEEWEQVAAGAMRKPEIYVHDRATYSLRKID